jgi:hypothetical protein
MTDPKKQYQGMTEEELYADVPDIIKQGMINAKAETHVPAPPPPVVRPVIPIKHQVKNFMETARQVVREAVQGKDVIVSQEKFDSRMNICLGCEFISADKSKCTACGCYLGAKLRFEASTCPKRRW